MLLLKHSESRAIGADSFSTSTKFGLRVLGMQRLEYANKTPSDHDCNNLIGGDAGLQCKDTRKLLLEIHSLLHAGRHKRIERI